MSANPSHLDRFLSAAHRRFVVARALERLGLCVLIGCAVAAPLVGVLLSRGQPAMMVTGGTLVLSVACGLVLAVVRAPRRLQAAIEVDRQLQLADLLSSACLIEARATDSADPWQRSVLAMAEARCRGLRPSAVIFKRWGSRAWGGVGLAVAMVLTLALFSSAPVPTHASTGPSALFAPPSSQSRTEPAANVDGADARTRMIHQPQSADLNTSASNTLSDTGPAPQNATASNTSASDPANNPASDGQALTGSGSAESLPHKSPAPPQTPSTSNASPPTRPDGQLNAPGGEGSGSGDPSAPENATARSAQGDATTPGVASATWSGSLAPTDRQAADLTLHAGKVPDQYHDMVRDYFQSP